MPNSIICLSFDFDAYSVWYSNGANVTQNMLERGEFGARHGVPRVLALLKQYSLPATFFIPGHTADSFPKETARIIAAGHEIGHHSYAHIDPCAQTPDEERADFERALAALQQHGVQPLGYRGPGGHSVQTLELLEEFGFIYDSSYKGGDFVPYRPRIGDQISQQQPLVRGREARLWELPTQNEFDDWIHFHFNFDPYRNGASPPSKVYEIWTTHLRWMDKHLDGGVLTVLMHPQIIGRAHGMQLLESFVEYALTLGVRFSTMIDVAKAL